MEWSTMKLHSLPLLAVTFIPTLVFAGNTLISPMVGGLDICQTAITKGITNSYDAEKYCLSINETSSSLLDKKLSEFGKKESPDGNFQIGYTLGFPILSYVDIKNDGSFSINKDKIKFRIKLLQDTNRDAVVYLFSNHFSVTNHAEVEDKIAKTDKSSLMQLSDGKNPIDDYFSSKTYPWAINSDGTLIDKVRKAAIKEILTQLCSMDEYDKNKIRAVTVLGEVHYTYPDFFNGMGYRGKMQLTDYSPASVAKFQSYLQSKYHNIEELNKSFDSEFSSFKDIYPPSKDINTDKLTSFFQHIDYASSGELAIYGWAAGKDGGPVKVKVFIDGTDAGYAEYGLNRLDVYQSMPSLGRASVGYRYYLDIKKLSHGIHTVDIVHDDNGKYTLMKHLEVPVMDRLQSAPEKVGKTVMFPQEKDIQFWNDYPESLKPVYYNPLSEEFYNFRRMNVSKEITEYANIISSSCIGKNRTFSHQIAPMFNGDWDQEKTAVSDSLKKNDAYNIGFNTYGAAFYGDITFKWLQDLGITRYGIPEAHPMVESQKIISEALEKHHQMGAVFISPYYIELQPKNFAHDNEHEKFKISADNTHYYSSSTYNAIKEVMER